MYIWSAFSMQHEAILILIKLNSSTAEAEFNVTVNSGGHCSSVAEFAKDSK